ncbi:pirin family protein [Microlunatus ginsengisoli]|uniref:Pirin family protein n=1 Tax=Microlunatus ginsengisoli TaxID=363863 RepID=A0ABP6ZBD3_9ACTN
MSDLELRPDELVCTGTSGGGPEELLLTARKVYLGKTTEVSRALPDRDLRMIGAWCFLDHYGPEDVSDSPGMQVWAHPHTGLQTVSWLIEGEIEHRDSLGSQVMVRPGELHIMTSGHGIVHSEISQPDKPPTMHGVQLWVALPDGDRDAEPLFRSYRELPSLDLDGARGKVLIGELDGVRSPAHTYTPLVGADLELEPGAAIPVAVDPTYEYGVFVVSGRVRSGASEAGVDQLLYLGQGRERLELTSQEGARVMILGGEPFAEEIVMWWNFVGRSHDEIVGYRSAWAGRADRFPPVVSRDEKVMEAPPMPTVPLKPRPRRRRSG